MGYSMRLELIRVCSLNGFQLFMGVHEGYPFLNIFLFEFLYKHIPLFKHVSLNDKYRFFLYNLFRILSNFLIRVLHLVWNWLMNFQKLSWPLYIYIYIYIYIILTLDRHYQFCVLLLWRFQLEFFETWI